MFQNLDKDNQEIIGPLISEYNSRVRSLLVEIQTDYGFRLHCHVIEYDDVAVWTDLPQVLLMTTSTPLVPQANQNANSNNNFNSYPHLDRPSTLGRKAWEEIHRLEEVANQWNRRSQHNCTQRGRLAVCGTPQCFLKKGRPQVGYARYNQKNRRYPNNRYNNISEVSYNECESRVHWHLLRH